MHKIGFTCQRDGLCHLCARNSSQAITLLSPNTELSFLFCELWVAQRIRFLLPKRCQKRSPERWAAIGNRCLPQITSQWKWFIGANHLAVRVLPFTGSECIYKLSWVGPPNDGSPASLHTSNVRVSNGAELTTVESGKQTRGLLWKLLWPVSKVWEQEWALHYNFRLSGAVGQEMANQSTR